MSDVWPIALAIVAYALGAWVTGPGAIRKGIGIGAALLALSTPWLLPPGHTVLRSVLAVGAFGGAMRAVDLLQGSWPLRARLWHAVSIVDTRKLVPCPPRLDLQAIGRAALWELAAAAFYALFAVVAPGARGPSYWAIRWGAGLGFVYTLSEGAYLILAATYRIGGLRAPRLHRHPAASRSVGEFWGRRWNLTVSAWLGETFFRPLARRGWTVSGVALAFFVSGVVHAYICRVAIGVGMSALMLGYFCAQGVLVGVERILGVPRWSAAPARLWAIGCMAALSPMFVEPMLQVFGS